MLTSNRFQKLAKRFIAASAQDGVPIELLDAEIALVAPDSDLSGWIG